MARLPAIETEQAAWITLNIGSLNLTDDQILQLCSANDDFQFEINAKNQLIIMPPANPESSSENVEIVAQLAGWTKRDGTGVCFGPDGGFRLPNGALRAPDASWMPKTKWNALSREERRRFPRICPDFVVELRSPSNPLSVIREKMEEYIANGARLGWFLDPIENRATIYMPGKTPKEIRNPKMLSGDPILPGFHFDFRELLDEAKD